MTCFHLYAFVLQAMPEACHRGLPQGFFEPCTEAEASCLEASRLASTPVSPASRPRGLPRLPRGLPRGLPSRGLKFFPTSSHNFFTLEPSPCAGTRRIVLYSVSFQKVWFFWLWNAWLKTCRTSAQKLLDTHGSGPQPVGLIAQLVRAYDQ